MSAVMRYIPVPEDMYRAYFSIKLNRWAWIRSQFAVFANRRHFYATMLTVVEKLEPKQKMYGSVTVNSRMRLQVQL
jgi:hypothetical protein